MGYLGLQLHSCQSFIIGSVAFNPYVTQIIPYRCHKQLEIFHYSMWEQNPCTKWDAPQVWDVVIHLYRETNRANWKITVFHGSIIFKWFFSIAVLVQPGARRVMCTKAWSVTFGLPHYLLLRCSAEYWLWWEADDLGSPWYCIRYRHWHNLSLWFPALRGKNSGGEKPLKPCNHK